MFDASIQARSAVVAPHGASNDGAEGHGIRLHLARRHLLPETQRQLLGHRKLQGSNGEIREAFTHWSLCHCVTNLVDRF